MYALATAGQSVVQQEASGVTVGQGMLKAQRIDAVRRHDDAMLRVLGAQGNRPPL